MVIFLDVDGVLNCRADWKDRFTIRSSCVDVLGEIARKTGCRSIVLSSTWRVCDGEKEPVFYTNLKKALILRGLTVVGTTPVSKHTRQEEIDYYARRHDCGKYLILDDDPGLFNDPSAVPLYIPDYRTGLTEKDIRGAYGRWTEFWK